MKSKIISIFVLLFISINLIFSQAKKPSIMIVPMDNWMQENGFMTKINSMGEEISYPDYRKATLENSDLINVISKVGELMSERGFPTKDLEASLKSIEAQQAEDAMLSSKSGAETSESPIDRLKKVAKADIWMQVNWKVITKGPKKKVDFTIRGIDAYTNNQVATSSGTGEFAMGVEPVELLREAILANLDLFNGQLLSHFDDMFENGRVISFRIKVWDDWDYDLETEEFGNEELGILIEDWMGDNTVNNKFSTVDATESMMFFDQVRIPLFNEKGRAIDARRWGNGLRKYLKTEFEIESKLMSQGLGQVQLILGSK
jgi:hypothetical protein|tara:strand:- start:938 stop:1888 length:951 start_codon:yes stop_codon:yes gene_type:complete